MLTDYISHILNAAGSPERLQSAMMALVLVCLGRALLGATSGNANPLLWVILERVFGSFARKTYNVSRSESSLSFRGGILLGLYLGAAIVAALFWEFMDAHYPFFGMTEILFLALTLSGGATWSALIRLHHALRADMAQGASALAKGTYYDIAVSTRTNLNSTDDHGIIRGGIGFVATSLDKGMVAPLFWYVLGGVPLVLVYAGVAAARWALAKEGFAKGIGNLALRLESIMGVLPQILTTLIVSFAALMTPSARLTRATQGIFSHSGRASYAEGGLPLTVLARALGIVLGGPVEDSEGSVLKRSWVGAGNATAKVDITHLRVAIYLSIMAHILVFALLLAGITLQRLFA